MEAVDNDGEVLMLGDGGKRLKRRDKRRHRSAGKPAGLVTYDLPVYRGAQGKRVLGA